MENLNESRSNLLGNESIPKLIWKFSVPAIVGMMVQALYNVVDRIFLGAGVNKMSIGGVYLTFPLFLFLMAFGMLIGIGGNSLSSIRFGEGKKKESEIILGTSLYLAIIFGVVISGIFLINLKGFLKIFGASDTLMPYAYDYGKIILFGAPFQMVGFAMNNFIRGEGNPNAAMITMFIGAITNIILDYIFIFPMNMGVSGAALATTIGQILSCAWVIRYFLSDKALLKLRKETFKFNSHYCKQIFELGISPFAMQIVASGINIILNNFLKIYGGDLATSSMSVIYSVSQIAFMPIFGINQGIQPILGFNFGAHKYRRVQHTLRIAIVIGSVYMILNWAFTMIRPDLLIKIFISRPEDYKVIKNIAIPGLRIYNCMIFLLGYQIVGTSLFQAIGKAKIGFILTMTRQLIYLLPLLLILPRFFGLTGVWSAIPISDALSTVTATYFLVKSGFLVKKIERDEDFVLRI